MKKIVLLFFTYFLAITLNAQCNEQFAAGSDHIIALKTDKTLWGFGRANAGQLTTQNNSHQLTPLQVSNLTDWYSIWAGGLNTFAIKNNGTLWATGANNSGSLGKGTTGVQYSFIQIGLATNWKKVATSGQHTIGIRTDGTLWGWGANDVYQLGQGSTSPAEYTPIQIGTATTWIDIAVVTDVGATVAIKSDGTLWGCGNGYNILFGFGNAGQFTSIPAQFGTDTDWQKVQAGSAFIIAQKNNGTLWIWGSGEQGEMGNGTFIATSPYQLTTDTWKDFAAGRERNYGIKTNGTLWAWGRNTEGQLGDGTFVNKNVPTQIGTATDWDRIYASGNTTTLGVKTDGTVWVWGNNNYGQFGNGSALNVGSNVPLQNTALCATLGVDGFTKANWKVYPNPASSQVQIAYDTNSEATIELYDMQGKLLKTMQTVGLQGTVSIPLANLSRGMYFVKFVTNDGVKQVEKLVVE